MEIVGAVVWSAIQSMEVVLHGSGSEWLVQKAYDSYWN